MKIIKTLLALAFAVSSIGYGQQRISEPYKIIYSNNGTVRVLGYFGGSNGGTNVNFVSFGGVKFQFQEQDGRPGVYKIIAKESINRNFCLAAYTDTRVNRNPLFLTNCQVTNQYDRTLLWKVDEKDFDKFSLISFHRSRIGGALVHRYVVANRFSSEKIKLKEAGQLTDSDIVDFTLTR